MSARGDLGEQVSELKRSRARLDEEQRLLDSHEKSVQQYQDLVEQQLAVYEGMDWPDGALDRWAGRGDLRVQLVRCHSLSPLYPDNRARSARRWSVLLLA